MGKTAAVSSVVCSVLLLAATVSGHAVPSGEVLPDLSNRSIPIGAPDEPLFADNGSSIYSALTPEATPEGRAATPIGLVTCLANASVPFTVPGDMLYASEHSTYNVHYEYAPAAIAVPVIDAHISSAVRCASASNVKVQAKGGGHSYASFSTGGRDGSLIVSMENYQNVTVDSNGIASVDAGLRLGNMALALNNGFQRAMPHGSCPGVGIGGHATHGGYGWPSRYWGLALDSIVGLDVVIADGSVLHTSSDENSDLFYALKGAAESFGIVTRFYMRTYPVPTSLVYFVYNFAGNGILNSTGDLGADIMVHIQSFAQNASVVDSRIGWGVYIDPSSFSWSGVFFGEKDEFVSSIKPEMLRTLPPSTETLQVIDWETYLVVAADGQPVVEATGSSYNITSNFFATSIFSPEATPITRDAWLTYFNYMITDGSLGNSSSWYSIIDHYGGPGSKINAVPSDATSFSTRDALFSFQHYGYMNDINAAFSPTVQPFVEGLNKAIPSAMPSVQFREYANYVNPSLTAEQAHDVYYGEPTYERLLKIKEQVDPGLVFWNPQAIGAE